VAGGWDPSTPLHRVRQLGVVAVEEPLGEQLGAPAREASRNGWW
jgi:hypothetical protein